MKRRPILFTIHGINSADDWQQKLTNELGQLFDYRHLKYEEYRRLGYLKIFLRLRVFALAPILLLILYRADLIELATVATVVIVSLLISLLLGLKRRQQVLHRLKTQIDAATEVGDRPLVIAHSFGTFLIGELIKKFPDISFGSVVLVGSVLPVDFAWEEHLTSVLHVRNEVAKHDLVGQFLSFTTGLLPGFGSSGLTGFNPSQFVHTIPSSSQTCPSCRLQSAKIHNVVCPFGHSGPFVGSRHPMKYWLPFLWGLDPPDYLLFVEECVSAYDLEHDNINPAALAMLEARLLRHVWAWAGCSLETFIGRQIRAHDSNGVLKDGMHLLVRRVLRATWNIVYKARISEEPPDLLYPRRAVDSAVRRVLRTMQRRKGKGAN